MTIISDVNLVLTQDRQITDTGQTDMLGIYIRACQILRAPPVR